MVPFDWTLWYTYPAYSVHDQVRPDQAKQVELQYVVIEVHQAVGDQTVRALRRLFVAHPTHHLLHFGMPLALAHAVADPFTLCLLSSGDHQPGSSGSLASKEKTIRKHHVSHIIFKGQFSARETRIEFQCIAHASRPMITRAMDVYRANKPAHIKPNKSMVSHKQHQVCWFLQHSYWELGSQRPF